MYVGLTQFDAFCAVPLKLDQIGEVQIEAPNYGKISFWSPPNYICICLLIH